MLDALRSAHELTVISFPIELQQKKNTHHITLCFIYAACPDNCEDCTYNIDLGKSECLVDGCENLYGHVTSDFTCKGQLT